MQTLIMAYETETDFKKRNDTSAFAAYMEPWRIYSAMLSEKGFLRSGAALEEPGTATVVSVRNGERIIEDGPFAQAKEQLGGYFIVETQSTEEAVRLASACPASSTGRVETYAIAELG
ncbi:MAG: YciI family protein [Pseudomonadota bacterium]